MTGARPGWRRSGRRRSGGFTLVELLVAMTLLGLIFVNPEIKSLFDAFIKVIGLFMGVLGGLFVLGLVTRKAHGRGALVGALVGTGVMFLLWRHTHVNGYIEDPLLSLKIVGNTPWDCGTVS